MFQPDLVRRIGRVLLITTLWATSRAAAQEQPAGWRFVISPYFLAPNMNGTVALGGNTVEVDADPGDIFDKLQFGAMLYFEASSPEIGFSLDALYMDLEQSLTGVDVGVDQTVIIGTVYRHLSRPLEILGGLQLNDIGMSLTGTGAGGVSLDGGGSWLDPFVGVRLSHPNSGKWRLALLGSIGGFGIGSDFAWQIYPQVGYRISQVFEVATAYRVMSVDYSRGTGVEVFRYDVTTFGPQLGLAFHF